MEDQTVEIEIEDVEDTENSVDADQSIEEIENGVKNDPTVIKLLEYGRNKKIISYDELSDYLPQYIADSEKIEVVLALLESNNIQLVEEDLPDEVVLPVKTKRVAATKPYGFSEKKRR